MGNVYFVTSSHLSVSIKHETKTVMESLLFLTESLNRASFLDVTTKAEPATSMIPLRDTLATP